ncbi:GntR family transcriptional regulator [Bacillus sp. FJAT-27916]|mgnify:FL=1|uniref:GntR family transcriptional regulator n=1 Tax=Bacillaceae TaxID=186817 RepID=UPI000671202C|nr:GntR family transcriptional regulator [Bacillus sp. FJAT-27916]KMY45885.1 GntR family transcriptional regulator [Bacillus sp. FJAT-27916]
MTKYESIANEMRRRIKEGFYSIDQPIPDEVSLAAEFGSSRMTMRKALDLLVSEGLLFRKRGHGTFIIQMYKNQSLNVISDESLGLSNLVKDKPVSSKIIQFTIEFPSEEVAGHLAIGTKEPVYHIIRLRMVDHEPYVMEETYMPSNLIPGITEDILHASIYNYIQQSLDLKIGGAHRTIMADKSNELDQTYLECKTDDPILQVVQVGFLNNGVPFEYSFSRHRYDKFVFTSVTVKK